MTVEPSLDHRATPEPPTQTTATRETLEDYTLRFAPRSYRTWSTGVVAVSALGGIAYLADFAIGANIGIPYDEHGNPPGAVLTCHVCRQDYERPDMTACQTHNAAVCSLCLSTDKVSDHVLPAMP